MFIARVGHCTSSPSTVHHGPHVMCCPWFFVLSPCPAVMLCCHPWYSFFVIVPIVPAIHHSHHSPTLSLIVPIIWCPPVPLLSAPPAPPMSSGSWAGWWHWVMWHPLLPCKQQHWVGGSVECGHRGPEGAQCCPASSGKDVIQSLSKWKVPKKEENTFS